MEIVDMEAPESMQEPVRGGGTGCWCCRTTRTWEHTKLAIIKECCWCMQEFVSVVPASEADGVRRSNRATCGQECRNAFVRFWWAMKECDQLERDNEKAWLRSRGESVSSSGSDSESD